jgi:predicted ATPase
MKYAPYSFFREFISAIFGYTISQKLFFENDFSMFKSVDPDGLVRDLITLSKRPETDNVDTRYVYFDIFLTLMQIIPKTLIFVEDFEKIDSSSYEILKYLFSSFEQLDIGFLISYDKEFSLHKDCHFLLTKSFYSEITLKPATFESIIEDNRIFYKDIMNDFYFQRIAKYSCGSSLFIDIAIQYLIESGVYEADETTIQMVNPKTVIIPSSLDKLVARRLNLLQDDAQAMKFLTTIVLLGTRVDMGTINTLGYENKDEILNKLADMGYLYEYNECIYFPNYNLFSWRETFHVFIRCFEFSDIFTSINHFQLFLNNANICNFIIWSL